MVAAHLNLGLGFSPSSASSVLGFALDCSFALLASDFRGVFLVLALGLPLGGPFFKGFSSSLPTSSTRNSSSSSEGDDAYSSSSIFFLLIFPFDLGSGLRGFGTGAADGFEEEAEEEATAAFFFGGGVASCLSSSSSSSLDSKIFFFRFRVAAAGGEMGFEILMFS